MRRLSKKGAQKALLVSQKHHLQIQGRFAFALVVR
ncbi:hypothetical protein X474_01225 [Dethiosulfatarculus sandiegensis]|uniref:Uncharacterized protein n=1 Tax=Dethiosulfatarculus sandiegensis TaxID=1429043 RepID=A0A0D2K3G2_9BACT|nr:hypothetical protein X474_01225 [Dethiosulfatarculus sandiegensis]